MGFGLESLRATQSGADASDGDGQGWAAVPQWLECETVLGLGGGPKGEQRKRYREHVENALREGLTPGSTGLDRKSVV